MRNDLLQITDQKCDIGVVCGMMEEDSEIRKNPESVQLSVNFGSLRRFAQILIELSRDTCFFHARLLHVRFA